VSAREYLAAIAQNRARESVQILERMKLSLSWKPESGTCVPEIRRRSLYELDIEQTCAMSSVKLLLELVALAVSTEKQVTIDALEVAVDVFLGRYRFNTVDSGGVTFGGELRTVLSVKLFDLVIAIVERVGEMRRCATGFAASNRTIIYDGNCTARTGEQIGRGHAGDSGSHNAYVDSEVLGELWKLWRIACCHPDGGRAAGVASHAMNFGRMIAVESL
jgi:hypothetical protein